MKIPAMLLDKIAVALLLDFDCGLNPVSEVGWA